MPINDTNPWYGYGPESIYAGGRLNFPRRGSRVPPARSPQGVAQAPSGQPTEVVQSRPMTAVDRLKAGISDPRLRTFLLTAAMNMGQAPQFGQTGWGQLAQSLGQGYNALAMAQQAQSAAEAASREEQRKISESQAEVGLKGAQAEGHRATAKKTGAEAAEIPKDAQSQRDLRKSQGVQAEALAGQARANAAATPQRVEVEKGELARKKQKDRDDLALTMEQIRIAEMKLDEAMRMGKSDRDLNNARAYSARAMADARKKIVEIAEREGSKGQSTLANVYARLVDMNYPEPMPGEEDDLNLIRRRREEAGNAAMELMKKAGLVDEAGKLRKEGTTGFQKKVATTESAVTRQEAQGPGETGSKVDLNNLKEDDIVVGADGRRLKIVRDPKTGMLTTQEIQ